LVFIFVIKIDAVSAAVTNQAPMAVVSWQVDGLYVHFDAHSSSDPDGDKLTYKWNFGEGPDVAHPDTAIAKNKTVGYNYRFPGTYTATLTVDDGRLSSNATADVTVDYPQINPTGEHPFLIVKASDFSQLRSQASQDPWSNVKARAISKAGNTIDPGHWDFWFRNSDIAGAASLSYILDDTNKSLHKDKVVQLIRDGFTWADGGPGAFTDPTLLDGVVDNIGGCYFERQVRPGTFLVNAITAYDVVYNDLTSAERLELENKLELMVEKIDCGWDWNWFSVHAIWELFKGDTTEYYKWKNLYDQRVVAHTFTEDGWFSGGTNYARARFTWRRDSKYILMDIAEYTNTGRYYSDPRYRNFYEWFYGYAYTPMTSIYTFGDSGSSGKITKWDQHDGHAAVRAYHFSDLAGSLAALRFPANKTIDANLYSYVLMKQAYPQVQITNPTSRIFHDGGAVFVEDNYMHTALSGFMNNNTKRVWHTHSDVNALHLTAYGENLIINSGYRGPNQSFAGFPWFYTSHEARANNTLTIDEVNHKIGPIVGNGGDTYGGACELPGFVEVNVHGRPCVEGTSTYNPPFTKRGAGISEGFTGNGFDYARGDTGYPDYSQNDPIRVVTNGRHYRNFIMIHPQDGLNGYFVTLDEVEAFDPSTNPPTPTTNSSVNLYFHPNSGSNTPGKFWYRFDGNLDETLKQGNYNARVVGSGYSFVPNRFGQYQALGGQLEQAINLNGAHVVVDNSEGVNFSTATVSISSWFKTTGNGIQTILSKKGQADDTNNATLYLDSNDLLSASVTNDNTLLAEVVTDTSGVAGPLNDGQWHNAVLEIRPRNICDKQPDGSCVYHYETTMSLYADGQLVNAHTFMGAMNPNTADPWYIGAELGAGGAVVNTFTGTIDDIKVHNSRWDQNDANLMSNQFASAPIEAQSLEEYHWDITGGALFNTGNPVSLAIALGKDPSGVKLPWSARVTGGSNMWQTLGYSLQVDFNTDSQGKANIPTILYPSDPTHPKADIQRIATANYDGLSVDGGSGLVDYIVAVPFDKPTNINVQNTDIDARSAIFRKGSGALGYYFVRNGTRLKDNDTQIGFESTDPISIHINVNTGNIVSPATELTIYDYDITSISLDGNPVTITESNPSYAKVTVPRGTFEISYTAQGDPPPTYTPTPKPPLGDANGDDKVDAVDYVIWLTQYLNYNPTPNADPDFNGSGTVDGVDYVIWLNNYTP
jgi:hypothetical protein